VAPALFPPAALAQPWYEINSGDVDIVSTLSKGDTAQVAQSFADYRAALHVLFPAIDLKPSPPVTLFVINRFGATGKLFLMCSNCLGVTVPLEAATYIQDTAFASNPPLAASVTGLHELTHQVLRQTYRGVLPVWLNEGMAELLSTVRRDQSGKLIVGLAPEGRWRDLQHMEWMPLKTVLAVRHDSKEYGSHEGAPAFYAESWLLVHYAQLARRERWQQIAAYINFLRQGVSGDDAIARAFPEGITGLEAELRAYARQKQFVGATLEVPLTTAPPVRELSSAEGERRYAGAMLDVIVARHDVPSEDLARYVHKLADDSPKSPQAQLLLAIVYMTQGKTDQARPLLEHHCAEPLTGADVALLCASAMQADAQRKKDPASVIGAFLAMRTYCEAALRIAPDDLHAWVSVADTYIHVPGDSSVVRAKLEQYFAATPSNYRIAKQLASLYIDVDLARAKQYEDQVLLAAQDPDEREAALRIAHAIADRLAAQETSAQPGKP
jgi:hypothetical protein